MVERLARGAVIAWALATIATVWGGEDAVWRWTFDDAFYYFEIARNLAVGHGSTFDRVNPTNGYHPLWMAVCASAYALGLDGMAAVRVLISIQLALYGAVAVGALTGLARHLADQPAAIRASAAMVGSLIAINASVANVFVNGLEAAASLPLQAAVLGWLIADPRPVPERRGLVALSVLLTGAFLARTDAGLLALLVLVHGARQGGGLAFAARVGTLPAAALALFLGLNQWAFGSPMQVSGDLKRVAPSLGQWALIGAMLGLAALLTRVSPAGGFARLRAVVVRGWPSAAFACLVIAYYLGFQTFPRVWYFVPVALLLAVLACAGASDLLELALNEGREKDPAIPPLRAIAPLTAMAALTLGGAAIAGPLLGGVYASSRANAEAARWVADHLPADTVLGSWDAGVIGYFAPQTVINLDGVVNSVAFKEALRAGTADEVARGWGLAWILNHSGSPEELRAAAEATLGPLPVFEVERTWPFVVVGGVNEVGLSEHEMAVMLVRIR